MESGKDGLSGTTTAAKMAFLQTSEHGNIITLPLSLIDTSNRSKVITIPFQNTVTTMSSTKDKPSITITTIKPNETIVSGSQLVIKPSAIQSSKALSTEEPNTEGPPQESTIVIPDEGNESNSFLCPNSKDTKNQASKVDTQSTNGPMEKSTAKSVIVNEIKPIPIKPKLEVTSLSSTPIPIMVPSITPTSILVPTAITINPVTATTTAITLSGAFCTVKNTGSIVNSTSSVTPPISTPSSSNKSSSNSNCNNTKTDITPSTDFDPIKIMEWKDGIGALPGSNLKFKINELGNLEMVDDEEAEEIMKKHVQKPAPPLILPKIVTDSASTNTNDPNETKVCVNCGIKGLRSEFIRAGRFCSQNCATLQSANLKIFKKNSSNANKPDVIKKKYFFKGNKLVVDNIRLRKLSTERIENPPREDTPPEGLEFIDANEEVEDIEAFVGSEESREKFSWKEYLSHTKSFVAPLKCFKENQLFPSSKNQFKVGMKLEGIDPQHASMFCVLTVAEVVGYRMRLHFDGYRDTYDFWVNANSPFIFPAGWCEKTRRKLVPPKNCSAQTFNWSTYLQQTKSQAAPKNLFVCTKMDSVPFHGFRIGMKLEAIDKANNTLVCVATIADVLDNWLLIHFDGWDDSYDYWTSIHSPHIHPVNWCRSKGRSLTPPKDYPKSSEKFVWSEYLAETKSIPAPQRAFRTRAGSSFRQGMKLEAVDKRNPRFIRVATILYRQTHSIKINFDGWDEKYSYWLDDDSCDIHPANWCAKTGHPIQLPIGYGKSRYAKEGEAGSSCPTPCCTGQGNIRGPRLWTHNTVGACPYSDTNLERETPDRLIKSDNEDESQNKSTSPPLSSCPNSPVSYLENKSKRRRKGDSASSDSDCGKRIDCRHDSRPSTPSSLINTNNKNAFSNSSLSTLHQAIFALRINQHTMAEAPVAWEKHSKNLLTFADKVVPSQVLTWTPQKVAEFVSTIPGCSDFGQNFEEQLIDGEAFLLLNQTDLVSILGIKLGPAVKIYNSILVIRDNINLEA